MKVLEGLYDIQIENPKLNEIPIPCHTELPKFFHLTTIYGSRGSGKTLALSNIIRMEAPFNTHIYWFSPTVKNDHKVSTLLADFQDKITYIEDFNKPNFLAVEQNIKDHINQWKNKIRLSKLVRPLLKKGYDMEDIFLHLIETGQIEYEDDIDLDIIDHTTEYLQSHKPIFSIIIDDELDSPLLTNRVKNPFNHFVSTHRHYFTNLYILIQNYTSINNIIRRNAQEVLIFPTKDLKMLEFIFKEVAGLFPNGFEQFLEIMKEIEKTPYSFLFIDSNSKQLRKGLTDLIIL